MPVPHGTLIVAIVCTDGILIASDTRASWKDDNKVLFAYVDSFQKIFRIGKFQLAISGVSTFNGIYLNEITDSFNKSISVESTLLSTFDKFKNFLKEKYHVTDVELDKNKFILAGYENNLPVITGFETLGKPVRSPVLTSEAIVNPYWRIPNPNPYTCVETMNILEPIYQKCSTLDKSIGGPTYFLKVQPGNRVSELKKVSFKHFRKETDFIKAILNGETEVTYLFKESKKALKGILLRRLNTFGKTRQQYSQNNL